MVNSCLPKTRRCGTSCAQAKARLMRRTDYPISVTLDVREQVVKPATAVAVFFAHMLDRHLTDKGMPTTSSARLSIANLSSHVKTHGEEKNSSQLSEFAGPSPNTIRRSQCRCREARKWLGCVTLAIPLIAAYGILSPLRDSSAKAGSATTTLTVTARVVRSCRLSTNANGATVPGDGATLNINCANGANATIPISSMTDGSGTSSSTIQDPPVRIDQDASTVTVNF